MKRLWPLFLACCTSSSTPTTPAVQDASAPDAGLEAEAPDAGLLDFSNELGSYETVYDAHGARGKNVRLAASRVNGKVLPAGGDFSFNDTVGHRTAARGFQEAGVIFKGEMTHGMGGGVCQVSSTLHAAALMTGLEVLERTPHSRPSGYIPMGLDATVTIAEECEADPKSKVCYIADLRFHNPFPVPVRFALESLPSKHKGMAILRAAVWGSIEPLPRPIYTFKVKDEKPFERRIRESEDAGAPTMVQKGIVGRTVLSKILIHGKGADDVLVSFESKYPPADEVWEVPLGYEGDIVEEAGISDLAEEGGLRL